MSGIENVKELQRRVEIAMAGGSDKAKEKHKAQGKMLVRERLEFIFDNGEYLEDGLLVGASRGMPGDAVVTAIGKIDGREVAVIANDMTVKAGTWGYHTFRKIVRMQEIAVASKMPIIYLVDSAGARIDSQFDCYLGRIAWGNIFYTQVQISGVVPQICVLFGPSPAGSAYVPALCDLIIMVDKQATAYLGSPRLAEMAIGEKVTEEQMGGARMHCAVSGLGDYLAQTEDEALKAAVDYLRFFPSHNSDLPPLRESQKPSSSRKISEIVPPDQNRPFDVKELIESLVDADSLFEVKALFAKEMFTGLAYLGGRPVGIVANNSKNKGGVLFNDSADKATRFIWACNAFNVPLLFLQDISGYMIGSAVEKAGIIRHGAKLLHAVCEAKVPRISVMIRKGYGGGYLAMSGGPTQPDAQLALPGAMPALMGPEAAINAIHFNEIQAMEGEERERFIAEKRQEYAKDINAFDPADQFSFEAVVDPDALREDLIKRFTLYSRRAIPRIDRRNGIYPV
ncbi:acyl-CoA carboxylase subunit beta [Pseudomonas sp. NPDC089395]|uniref:acyl-CoA carboxylase subunit beta n=1 Tax=unclassified Pseudomonas TaxID=196821 RepID=UPI003008DF1F